MSYNYSEKMGMKPSENRPAGTAALVDHMITRFEEYMPTVQTIYGTATASVVPMTYAYEYPEQLLTLPYVAIAFINELSEEVGLGMVAAGESAGEYSGFSKTAFYDIDIWARNSWERQLIYDAIMNAIHVSRKWFQAKGIRDLRHENAGTRNFEQAQAAMYYRQAQQSTKVFRSVITVRVEYDLVFTPPDQDGTGVIDEVEVTMTVDGEEILFRVGHIMDLILDSRYVLKEQMEDIIKW